jgi:hypothetical protein
MTRGDRSVACPRDRTPDRTPDIAGGVTESLLRLPDRVAARNLRL